ncbi:dihydroneopterin aldolase [Sulfurimonas sp. CVO]|jgi:dihydroneopterin aldolase|uniref:dihydroneopterin aldolase n=1 Tax=Sulfurimonas xiamenensis TaxID=2590021 RepID=A0AAJ4DM92_9BACT|nr:MULTISPECIES: dihydroneopterin aldolase [Sulfurimonas]PLY16360.1 MAG: dihydroneopterin aldolase [Sulfurimonas sp.]QFR42939.1 dihydroneopterin aldolase [Sulfurimonas xiamenensis]QHG91515.1 dihydroneopterin aldolase [Sulfurimonas sp. CVO]
MTIHIEDLKFQCIIGILDFERTTPQDVIINLTIEYNYKNNFINYADVVEIIKKTMIKSEFFLIEDALESLNLKLIKEYKAIKSINLKITKPSILPDCKVSVSNYCKSQS